jgi:DNA-binding NarL/FixJ family response regulator
MIKIGIVDDKRIIRANLRELAHYDFIDIVLIANNGAEFLEEIKILPAESRPEIVLMDIDMPEMDGITAIRHAKVIYPHIEFLVLTVFDEDEKIFETIKAGASGYLLKDESIKNIAHFIQQVKEFRAVPMSPAIARKTLRLLSEPPSEKENASTPHPALGQRETEVLRLMVEGLDYKEISERLNVSHYTVRNQITSIYQKLHVTCKVDAVKLAIKNKFI